MEVRSLNEYIDSLKLEDPPPSLLTTRDTFANIKSDEESANVDAGSLISFDAKVTSQQKKDVLNSTLLAQLAANYAHDREADPVGWYKKYREVLENTGWTISGWNFNQFNSGSARFSADKVIIDILTSIATGNQMLIVKETIDALNALDNGDGRVTLFDRESTNLTKGNFQVAVSTVVSDVVVLQLGAFYFETNHQVTRVLFFEFESGSTSFYKGAQTVNLNEEIYSRIRQKIVDKLGDRAEQYIDDLPIGG